MSGILTYRVLRNTKKYYLKLIHASIMIVSFVLAVVALKAVFDSHNLPDPPLANLYSLHSWIGISTVALFAFQVSIAIFDHTCYFIITSYVT